MFCSFCNHLKKILCTCSFGFFFVLSYLRESNISSVFFFFNSHVMNFWADYSVVGECEDAVCSVSTSWELARFSLWPNIWSIFVSVPCPFGKNTCDLNISEACVYLLNQTYDVACVYPFLPPHMCACIWSTRPDSLNAYINGSPCNFGFVSISLGFQPFLLYFISRIRCLPTFL